MTDQFSQIDNSRNFEVSNVQGFVPSASSGFVTIEHPSAHWVSLHNRAMTSARNLKVAYIDLLRVLIEIERDQVFYQLKTTSLHDYCVNILGLPTHTAYDFIDVIRTSKDVPALAEAIYSGRTTISKVRRVCSVITPKNQKEWINAICECSFRLIKKMVALANPRAAVEEKIEYVAADVLEINFSVSEKWVELLAETKDLLSSREKRAVSTEEAVFILMSEFKHRNDPVMKAERAIARRARKSAEHARVFKRSRYIASEVEHEVDLRDRSQCTFVNGRGERCPSKRWLEKHHRVEFANGGAHTAENLETLCSGHHRMKHRLQN